MAEIAPSPGGGSNRTFLFIVGGLAALLIVGLLALGAVFTLPGMGQRTAAVAVTATATRVVIPPTATRTPLPSPTLVVLTDTPVPTQVVMTATPIPITATPIPITATPEAVASEELPESGLGEDLMMLSGAGFLLLGVIVVMRRLRAA